MNILNDYRQCIKIHHAGVVRLQIRNPQIRFLAFRPCAHCCSKICLPRKRLVHRFHMIIIELFIHEALKIIVKYIICTPEREGQLCSPETGIKKKQNIYSMSQSKTQK